MSSHHLSSKQSKAYALLLVNTALWGFAGPIIKKSLDYVSPNQFLLGRYVVASLIFLPIFFHLKKRLILNTRYLLLAILGTPLTLIPLYYGLKLTTSLEASILVATGPLLTILGGWFFLKEKIAKHEWVGIVIALFGTAILTITPLVGLINGERISVLGNILVILSNLIWTVFLLLSKRFKTDAAQISLTSYLVSIPAFALLVLLEPSSPNTKYSILNTSAAPGILYMAIFGSVIAFWAYTKAQEYVEASEAAVFSYLQPLFALPLSVLWLHEPLTMPIIASSAVIALGVYISEKR